MRIQTIILSKALAIALNNGIIDVLPHQIIDLPVTAPPDCYFPADGDQLYMIHWEIPVFTAPPAIPDIREKLMRNWQPNESPEADCEDEPIDEAMRYGY